MPNLIDAVQLVQVLERCAPAHGFHVALTGGCVFKFDQRKDIDLVVYRIRQQPNADIEKLLKAFDALGLSVVSRHGFVTKAKYLNGMAVDILFPEANYGDSDYPPSLPETQFDLVDITGG